VHSTTEPEPLTHKLTRALDLEGGSNDVESVILDAHVVIPRDKRRVTHFVSFFHLSAIHGHLGGAIDGDGQGARARGAGVHDEVGLVAGLDLAEAVAHGVHRRGVGVLLAHLDPEGRSGDVDAVELGVD